MFLRNLFSKSIYAKLYLLFFLIGVLPLLLGTLYTYKQYRQVLLERGEQHIKQELTTGMRNTVILFEISSAELLLTAQNSAFVRYFEEPEERDVYGKAQEKALRYMISIFPDIIESAGFIDRTGKVINVVSSADTSSGSHRAAGTALPGQKIGSDILGLPAFQKALTLTKNVVYTGQPVYLSGSQKWVIPVTTPILNHRGRHLGVLYLEIRLESFLGNIQDVIHPFDTAFIVDQGGHFVVYTRIKPGPILTPALQTGDSSDFRAAIREMRQGVSGLRWISVHGDSALIHFQPIPVQSTNENRWSIGIITLEDHIYGSLSSRNYILLVSLGSLLLLAIAGLLGRWISRPIKQLTRASLEMRHGHLSQRVTISQQDEIGQLAGAFNEMASAIQLSYEEIQRLAITDGLTGLHNHREFQKRLDEEISRSRRYQRTASLIMMDLDHFKRFNDTYGHPAGDAVLRTVGTAILQTIRTSDFAARYGGEEMAVILPETEAVEAKILAERIREKVRRLPIPIPGNDSAFITMSIGIATFPEDAGDVERLIETADQALYFAKERGRNQTVMYGETLKALLERKPKEVQNLLSTAEEWFFKEIATAVEARLPFARGHSDAVSRYAQALGEALGLMPEMIRDLRVATLLQNVGTFNIPEAVLLKQGPLTPEEWEIVHKHPEWGENLLLSVMNLKGILPVVRHHHEWYDGTGYPVGLKGEEIPLCARIIRVVDSYQAMTSVSPYHSKLSQEAAIEELRRHSGTQFDPKIVEVFINILNGKRQDPSVQMA
ncbi:MAG: diguanylate cyclase [Nitrospirae bacterium]|nr:diguanylate cyclase [Nitrospirota bacterium]